MKSFLKYWLPLVIWLGVIFVGSTDLMSAQHTSRFIVPFLRWLNPDISWAAVNTIHTVIRKLGHVIEYAILALVLWRALCSGPALRTKTPILFGAVLLACALFAVTDEFHQSFVGSRTSSDHDVLLDSAGAFLGALIGAAFSQRAKTAKTNARSELVDARS
ncbi:MAG: VanZ family protein [Candidatus Udaeobacter sp.]